MSDDYRTGFYNYIMKLAGKIPAHKINLAWQTIGSFCESGHRHIPTDALQHFSRLSDPEAMLLLMHCNETGYLELWMKFICKECSGDWGYVRMGNGNGDWVRTLECPYCQRVSLTTDGFEVTYLG